jgi:hypothetical protein
MIPLWRVADIFRDLKRRRKLDRARYCLVLDPTEYKSTAYETYDDVDGPIFGIQPKDRVAFYGNLLVFQTQDTAVLFKLRNSIKSVPVDLTELMERGLVRFNKATGSTHTLQSIQTQSVA